MVARAEFGALFVDYYLHLGANAMKPALARCSLIHADKKVR